MLILFRTSQNCSWPRPRAPCACARLAFPPSGLPTGERSFALRPGRKGSSLEIGKFRLSLFTILKCTRRALQKFGFLKLKHFVPSG